MKANYSANRRTLTLSASPEEQANLIALRRDEPEEWGTSAMESEAMEPLTGNSELEWINPADTGVREVAPMLGIRGDEQREESGPHGVVHTGGDEQGPRFAPILERWAFMGYQVRSFLDDLADDGAAVFIS